MRDPDAILTRFPGPVTLYVGRGKKLLAFALSLGLAAFMAWLLFGEDGRLSGRYDMIMAPLSLVVFLLIAVRAVVLLLLPPAASLRLDADGFDIGHVFHRVRTRWRDVRSLHADENDEEKAFTITYVVAEPGKAQEVRALPDNYGLTKDQLTWLLEEWRKRALAR